MPNNNYKLLNILPANELLLANDVFLIILYANRVPPHLAITVNGKLFTLTVKGATIDGELPVLLRSIKKNKIPTLFVKLDIPQLFTLEQLKTEIKKFTLAYPRVDIGVATCLTPIKDFCHSVYNTDIKNVNYVFDLLPKLESQKKITSCYQMNMIQYLSGTNYVLPKYTFNEIYDAVRANSILVV